MTVSPNTPIRTISQRYHEDRRDECGHGENSDIAERWWEEPIELHKYDRPTPLINRVIIFEVIYVTNGHGHTIDPGIVLPMSVHRPLP